MNIMKLNWKKILPLIGVVLFIYILTRLDFLELWQTVKKINPWYCLFLPFLVLLILYLQTLKWWVLLKSQGIKVELAGLFKIHLVSSYYAFITPSRVGYFVKIPYLQSQSGLSATEISGSVIIDRILDVFTLLIFALLGSLSLLSSYPNVFFIFLAIFLAFVIIILFFYSKKRARSFASFFKRIIPDKLKEKLEKIFNELYNNFPAKRKLLLPVLLSAFIWFILYSQTYLIALSLGINIDYWHFIGLLPISTMITLLPITINGLGTREAALILLFSSYNVPQESIVAMSLIGFILFFFLPALCGGFLSFKFSAKST